MLNKVISVIKIPSVIPREPAKYPRPKNINLKILTEKENEKSGIEN